VREVAGRILTMLGYEVESVDDGASAVAHYAAAVRDGRPFHTVIMDLTIPGGMGGKETVQKLREIDPAVRAIVSSGYSNDPIMAEYRSYGFCGVVSKPYSIKTLGETVKAVLAAAPLTAL
jgi:CheY-like chemotaxis protein